MTMPPAATGDTLRLLVRGHSGPHSVECVLAGMGRTEVYVRLANNKIVVIPLANVLTAEFRTAKSNGAQRSDRRGTAKLPGIVTDHLEDLDHVLAPTSSDADSRLGGEIAKALTILRAVQSSTALPLQDVLEDVCELVECCLERLLAGTYEESERLRRTLLVLGEDLAEDLASLEGKVPINSLSAFVERFRSAEQENWKQYSNQFDPQPRIITTDRLTLSVDSSQEFDLPVRVSLDRMYVPARGLTVELEDSNGIFIIARPAPLEELRNGETRTLTFRMSLDPKLAIRDVVFRAHLMYRGIDGDPRYAVRQNIRVALRPRREFIELSNPYRRYSGGLKVDDPAMFFGRERLVQEVAEAIGAPSMGRCFAIYGQQRSGKSSAVGQIRDVLERKGVLVASVTMGIIDRSDLTPSFVSAVLDQFRLQVVARLNAGSADRLLNSWPTAMAVQDRPLKSLQAALSASRLLLPHRVSPPFVVIADEFTYLFEVLRREHVNPAEVDMLRDFMRQWKGLIEGKVISALIVGQDTMPAFLNAFANEFSIMHTQRLDYLSADETQLLADRPTRYADGRSRFTGYALSAIVSYTDGHPFFTQILCDRLVTLANSEKRDEIAESNVHAAVGTLVVGEHQIDIHRFGCLLSADNTGTVEGGDDGQPFVGHETARIALRVLKRLADLSGSQHDYVDVSRLALSGDALTVWDDLVVRRVVHVLSSPPSARIRVRLFADYLRQMT